MSLTTILKRDGHEAAFRPFKIENAIEKAFDSLAEPTDELVYVTVLDRLVGQSRWSVEAIQDLIERVMFERGHFGVMRSFMLYRHTHKLQREQKLGLDKSTTYIDCNQSVGEYISKNDWRIAANANTGYSNAGLINNTAGKVIANYWLDRIYDPDEGAAHREGDFHIHDLDCLSGYCAGWSLRALLNEGFNGVRGRVEARAPGHLREALGQMANFLGILQSEWAGAQAFSSFDTYLAPYLFKDKLSDQALKKAITSFIYNLNVPARWGQSPFTNITLDWTVPADLADQIPTRNDCHLLGDLKSPALLAEAKKRGAKSLDALTYRHFQPEMERINRAYFEVMTDGDSGGQPFTFPIPTVNITEDFDWYGPNTDILFENTARIGSAYFQNFIGSQYTTDKAGNRIPNEKAYKPGAVRSMCCRLQLDLRELLKRGGGLFGSAEMTGSIGVVTLNMARLGYRFKGDETGLTQEMRRLAVMAKNTLEKKRTVVTELFERGLYPYTARYLRNFNNHFSTIGVNGMNEMIRNFTSDRENIATEWGQMFALRLLDILRDMMRDFQSQSGNLYNLEATPAEGTTYRLAREDRKRYEGIIQAGTPDAPYYTNSSQLPVFYTDDPFEALDRQDELQCCYTGGTVLHLYMRERIDSPEACRKLVRNVIGQYRLPYITLTPTFSVCPKHGYLSGEHIYCPKCDEALLTKYENQTKPKETTL